MIKKESRLPDQNGIQPMKQLNKIRNLYRGNNKAI